MDSGFGMLAFEVTEGKHFCVVRLGACTLGDAGERANGF